MEKFVTNSVNQDKETSSAINEALENFNDAPYPMVFFSPESFKTNDEDADGQNAADCSAECDEDCETGPIIDVKMSKGIIVLDDRVKTKSMSHGTLLGLQVKFFLPHKESDAPQTITMAMNF